MHTRNSNSSYSATELSDLTKDRFVVLYSKYKLGTVSTLEKLLLHALARDTMMFKKYCRLWSLDGQEKVDVTLKRISLRFRISKKHVN
ncbi:MAG TPA: hypothetical protein ACFCUD_00570 [Cyclobacteriaceae bacterium]